MDSPESWDEPGGPTGLDDGGDLRAAYCRKVARATLKRFGIVEPPVPVDALARRLGFQIRFERLAGGVDGRLRVLGDAKVIEVALGQAPSRQRFTIAHELGHFLLGHGYEETKVAERQANIFAGALLAPGAWLARDLGGFPSAAALASRYEVSREVIFIAAKDARLLGRLK